MNFYLGIHMPGWMSETSVPLFVSRVRLDRYRNFPIAKGRWALDSGAFSEISTHGSWIMHPREYAYKVHRYQTEIGNLDWAAPMDWMCEPFIVAKTGKSVEEHQRLTVNNYLELRAMNPIFIPVLQGWELDDYCRHVDAYGKAGVDLDKLPVVGLGSVCRRQDTMDCYRIVEKLHSFGIKLHGFGFKKEGIEIARPMLVSADSMAWSYAARRESRLPGCTHACCSSCLKYALQWRNQIVNR